jgi:predicted phage baseplate assembly protein
VPENDLRFERDPVSQVPTAVWVTWHSKTHLYNSGTDDRDYTVERGSGLIRFGRGQQGLIPPAGSRIVATYRSGGGAAGNVPANSITELRTALPFIQSATNPVPASGGAVIETTDAVKQRGPQRLRNRNRAVSVEDCEWLAREASPDVARVRCLPITGSAGHAQRGWITLVVAPRCAWPDPQPQPSPEFRRRVRDYLAGHVPATVARRVRIAGPQYVSIRVRAEIVLREAGAAAQVEASVRLRLNHFLHPLMGGPEGKGWAFGQSVYQSQIARVIEETPGVDYAREIRLLVDDQIFAEVVPVDAYTLVAAGAHELKLSAGAD